MAPPIKSLHFGEPQVINLNLLDTTFEGQVGSVRLLLRGIHDNGKRISTEAVFELGLIRVVNTTVGDEWTMDYQIVWPEPLMDRPQGELKLVNWNAVGGNSPSAGKTARKKATQTILTKIGTLIEPEGPLVGRVEIVSP